MLKCNSHLHNALQAQFPQLGFDVVQQQLLQVAPVGPCLQEFEHVVLVLGHWQEGGQERLAVEQVQREQLRLISVN